jgi:hypothetical protein
MRKSLEASFPLLAASLFIFIVSGCGGGDSHHSPTEPQSPANCANIAGTHSGTVTITPPPCLAMGGPGTSNGTATVMQSGCAYSIVFSGIAYPGGGISFSGTLNGGSGTLTGCFPAGTECRGQISGSVTVSAGAVKGNFSGTSPVCGGSTVSGQFQFTR